MAYESLRSELEKRLVDMQSRLANIKIDVTRRIPGTLPSRLRSVRMTSSSKL